MIKKVLLLLSFISLAACSPPPLEFNPESVPVVGKKIPAKLSHVSLRFATGDRRLGDISMATEIQTDYQLAFVSALESAALKSLVFTPSSGSHVLLEAELLKLEGAGKWRVSEMVVNYKIMDLQSGRIVFEEKITSRGNIELNTALRGDIRSIAPTVVNDVTRNNISEFINALKKR